MTLCVSCVLRITWTRREDDDGSYAFETRATTVRASAMGNSDVLRAYSPGLDSVAWWLRRSARGENVTSAVLCFVGRNPSADVTRCRRWPLGLLSFTHQDSFFQVLLTFSLVSQLTPMSGDQVMHARLNAMPLASCRKLPSPAITGAHGS
ncbi:hypothetical protein MRX96_031537 [Rhipicephalus microplus]